MAEPLDVKVLEAIEAIRRRPLMYVTSTDRDGLHFLVGIAVDCAAEEAYAGFVREIDVTLLPGDGVRVRDDGRGIPVEPFRDEGRSTLEAVLTTLFTGCRHEPGALAAAGQPQGIGAVVVNALSTRLDAEVERDGYRWTMSFAAGRPTAPLTRHEATERSGTTLTFRPDPAIFDTTVVDAEALRRHLDERFGDCGARIAVRDERGAYG